MDQSEVTPQARIELSTGKTVFVAALPDPVPSEAFISVIDGAGMEHHINPAHIVEMVRHKQ
jgi:hypothetical protein